MLNSNQSDLSVEIHAGNIGNTLLRMRELRELSKEEVARSLRLQTGIIELMESESFPGDLPEIFAKGYLKSYARLLQFSDHDIKAMLDSFHCKDNALGSLLFSTQTIQKTSHLFTYLLTGSAVLIMIALLFTWLEPTFYSKILKWFTL